MPIQDMHSQLEAARHRVARVENEVTLAVRERDRAVRERDEAIDLLRYLALDGYLPDRWDRDLAAREEALYQRVMKEMTA